MEKNTNPMPRFDLFPRISRVGHFIFDQLRREGLSGHNRGAAAVLDAALMDGPNQMEFDYDGDE